jgi:hypothetical protein
METLCANIVDRDGNYLTEDVEIIGDDFDALIEQAKSYDYPVCIRWSRPTDGQVAYWSPRGASIHPHWYNTRGGAQPGAGAPEKPEPVKKRQVGLQLSGWVIDALDRMDGNRQASVEEAVIGYFKLQPPTAG